MKTHCSLLVCGTATILLSVHSSPAAVATWDGSIDGNWASAAAGDSNWTGGAGTDGLAIAGDSLVFTSATGLGGTTLNNNNAANTSFADITFDATAVGYTINGNAITLAGNLVNNSTNLQTIATGLTYTGLHLVNTAAGNIELSGALSGTGGVFQKLGSGTLRLTGSGTIGTATSGTGTTTIFPLDLREGGITIDTAGAYAVTGEAAIGSNVAAGAGAAGSNVNLTLQNGALNVSSWFSVARGNGTGSVSSDVVLNNASTLTVVNFGLGFNNGSALNTSRGSVTLNDNSIFTVSNNNANFNFGESAGSYGTMTLNGSSKLVHNGNASGTRIGLAGTGILNIASGNAIVDVRNLIIGQGTNGVGAVYNRGTLQSIGLDGLFLGDGAGSASYFLNDNGAAAVANDNAATIVGGIGNNSNSVIDVASGTLSGTRVGAGFFNNTNATNTQFNVSGGELASGATGFLVGDTNARVNKWANINVSGSGVFSNAAAINLSNANNAANTGILSIGSGGTVTADTVTTGGTASNTFINIDNGTLRASSGTTASLVSANIDRVTVYSGGAVIDTNGFNKSIDAVIAAPDADGTTTFGVTSINLSGTGTGYEGRPVVKITGGGGTGATAVANFNAATGEVTGITITSAGSGYTSAPTVTILGGGGSAITATASTGGVSGGGITKTGTGILTLNNANTYTGATVVSAGTLYVNGSLNGTSGTTIASGATLGGTGDILTGTVSFSGAGFVNAGNSVGELGVSAADLTGGTLLVEYDTSTLGLIDLFNVAGLLDIGGSAVDFDLLGAGLDGTSTYTFATYGSLIGGSFSLVSDLPSGYQLDYGTGTNSSISLVPVPEARSALLGGLAALVLLRRRRGYGGA
jgi:hypothetical protein